jgi:hypothetical protein
MRLDATVHVFNHPTDQELILANAALSSALSNVTSTVSSQASTIASLVADGGSSAVSTAVDEEDTAVAGEISSALAAGEASTSVSA